MNKLLFPNSSTCIIHPQSQDFLFKFFHTSTSRPIPIFFPIPLIHHQSIIKTAVYLPETIEGFWGSEKPNIYIRLTHPTFFWWGRVSPGRLKICARLQQGKKKLFFCLAVFFLSSIQTRASTNTITAHSTFAYIDCSMRILVRIITVIGTTITYRLYGLS